MTPVLLPLYVDPSVDPAAWHAVAATRGQVTVVVADPRLPASVAQLARSGTPVLGRIDAAHATRPLGDLLDDVERWAACPVSGLFIDEAPTSAFCLGPMAMAVRLARRRGLPTVVLNPGIPPDRRYRTLGVPICAFEGSWDEYRRWNGDGSESGDGHLVHSVPPAALPDAQALLRVRGADWGLVTDRRAPDAYAGAPRWLFAGAALPEVVADTVGRSTTTGS